MTDWSIDPFAPRAATFDRDRARQVDVRRVVWREGCGPFQLVESDEFGEALVVAGQQWDLECKDFGSFYSQNCHRTRTSSTSPRRAKPDKQDYEVTADSDSDSSHDSDSGEPLPRIDELPRP